MTGTHRRDEAFDGDDRDVMQRILDDPIAMGAIFHLLITKDRYGVESAEFEGKVIEQSVILERALSERRVSPLH